MKSQSEFEGMRNMAKIIWIGNMTLIYRIRIEGQGNPLILRIT